jgi:hypothetical protein
MDIHHDTSLRSILENHSISSTSKARTRSSSDKGARLWLIIKPSMHPFHIAHFIFTSTLHFRRSLVQPLASSLFMCENEHELNKSSTHLACCLFGGQQIVTHDAIQDVMYAFCSRKWACYMKRVVVRPYIKSFIMN